MFATSPRALILLLELFAIIGWTVFLTGAHRQHGLAVFGMFPEGSPFPDFYTYNGSFANYHHQAFFESHPNLPRFAYPPALAPVYALFYVLPHRISVYLLCNLAVCAALLIWSWRTLARSPGEGIPWIVLLGPFSFCYPALFLVQRGNVEVFVWGAVALGLFFYVRHKPGPSAACIGIAAAFKLYPVLLLGLFCFRRRVRYAVFGVFVSAFVTLLALLYSGPDLASAARGFAAGVRSFQQTYGSAIRSGALRYDHSLFSVVKVLAVTAGRDFQNYGPAYYLVASACFGTLYLYSVRKQAWRNQVIFLSACMILLPPVSYEYTLVHLYVPAFLLGTLLLSSASVSATGVVTMVGLLALLLPLDLYLHWQDFLAGQVQSLVLVTVAALAGFAYTKDRNGEADRTPAIEGMTISPARPRHKVRVD